MYPYPKHKNKFIKVNLKNHFTNVGVAVLPCSSIAISTLVVVELVVVEEFFEVVRLVEDVLLVVVVVEVEAESP